MQDQMTEHVRYRDGFALLWVTLVALSGLTAVLLWLLH